MMGSIVTRISAGGNSAAVRLTKDVLNAARLERGQEVLISAEEGRIVITPGPPSEYTDTMAAYERIRARYGRVLDELAK